MRNPVGHITASKEAPATVRGIMVNYVAVLATIPFVATLVGDLWYYSLFTPHSFAGSFAAYAFTNAILVYILDVAAVYVVGVAIRFLAPRFDSTADDTKTLELSAFVFTPAFLIAALDVIPPLAFLTFIGVLYGLYILYLGLPIMLGTPKDRAMTYVIEVVIATIIVYFVIGAIISAITSATFLAGFA